MAGTSLTTVARRTVGVARRGVESARTRIGARGSSDDSSSSLDYYVSGAPSAQNVVDLFAGDWSSAYPPEAGAVTEPGTVPLFDDARIHWALEVLGGAAGRTVLELGPLEGAHTTMLERAGAASIDAIEANGRAFMRCLCTKEVLGLTAARFHLGDCVAFLESDQGEERYDLGIACGVLYHMTDPIGLLDLLGRRCERLFLWTQYFDAERPELAPGGPDRFGPVETGRVGEFEYQYVEQRYRSEIGWKGFCGGSAPGSRWLTLDSLDAGLRRAGFTEIEYGLQEPEGASGPSTSLCAWR